MATPGERNWIELPLEAERMQRISEDADTPVLERLGDHEGCRLLAQDTNERVPVSSWTTLPDAFASATKYKFGRLPKIRHLLTKIFLFSLPSFVLPPIPTSSTIVRKRLSPTAWLDGLRGIACFIVVIYHFTYAYFGSQEFVYDGVKNTSVLQLPIIRLLHAGPPMVKIFYIISGFALTIKAVSLTRVSGPIDAQALLSNLSTSIWKRYIRLYLPCAAIFLVCGVLVSLGSFETAPYKSKPLWLRGHIETRPPMEKNFFRQLLYTFKDFYDFALDQSLFRGPQRYTTDQHLWTIPTEFWESIQLFAIVAGLSTIKRHIRVSVFLPLLYCLMLYGGRWESALFIFGYFLAELNADIPPAAPTYQLPINEKISYEPLISLKGIIDGTTLSMGLFLISYPLRGLNPKVTTGFGCLYNMTPSTYPVKDKRGVDHTVYFWQSIGATLVVWALWRASRLRDRILCNSVAQYLGRISFALYLVHGQIGRSLGHSTVLRGWKAAGILGYTKHGARPFVIKGHEEMRAAVVIGSLFITIPISVWCADVFWRGVDVQSVRFVRWLEGKIRR